MPTPGKGASDDTNQAKQTRHPHPRHTTPTMRTRRKKEEDRNKNHGESSAKTKRRHRKTSFEPAAAVGGTSSIDMFYVRVDLVPCYPTRRFLHDFVYRRSPSTLPLRTTLPRIPSDWFPSALPVSLSPHSLEHHPRTMRGAACAAVALTRATSPRTVPLLEGHPGTMLPHFLVQ